MNNDLVFIYLKVGVFLDLLPLQIARARNISIDPFWIGLYLFLYVTFDYLNAFDNEPFLYIFSVIFFIFQVSLLIFRGIGNQE